jgi:uroporphyrinogen-III synthase
MHVLVTRAEPDASELKVQLEALGHTVTVEPLLQIEFMPLKAGSFKSAQALIATSRNGLRALAASPVRPHALKLPIFVVGPGTAELARTLGFQRIIEGAGTAGDLVPQVAGQIEPARGTVVYLAGETFAFDLEAALENQRIAVRKVTVYRAKPSQTLTARTAQLIASGPLDAVILMSPRTAAVFTQLVSAARLKDSAHRLAYLCLSKAVAQGLQGLGPVRAEVAAKPNTDEILRLVERVETRASGV